MGSKRRLTPFLLNMAPAQFHTYREPFAGSAALFFALAPSRAVLSDINPELITFMRVLRRSPIELHLATEHLMVRYGDDYYAIRRVQPEQLSRLDRAARFFYLNRRGFNGIYRTNRSGIFNVPEGRNTGKIPGAARLAASSHALRSTSIRVDDFETAMAKACEGDFLYLDPPYLRPEGTSRYGTFGPGAMERRDIDRLGQAVLAADDRGVKIMASFDEKSGLDAAFPPSWQRRMVVGGQTLAASPLARGRAIESVVLNYAGAN